MSNKFSKGDYIRYSTNGVCLVKDVTKLDYTDKNNMNDFYILSPVSTSSSTIFVPVNNQNLVSNMRPLLTKDQIDGILEDVKENCFTWVEDRKLRTDTFKTVVKTADQKELVSLIRCIYAKKRELTDEGKKLSSVDESILEQAEKLVEDEFGFVLNITKDEVKTYIKEKLAVG